MIYPLLDALPDGICITDEDGMVLYMNPAAERLLDLPAKTLAAGKTLCDSLCGHMAADGKDECASGCPVRGGHAPARSVTINGRYQAPPSFAWSDSHVQRQARMKNLRVRCLKTPESFPSEGERRNVTFIEDATAERALSRELECHKEDWRSMIAHDLRSPLTSVFATLRMLQEAQDAGRPEVPEPQLLDISVRSCKKMLELLDLYLDVARLDAGLMPVELEPLDLHALLRGCVEEQAAFAQEKRIKVELALGEPAALRGDAELLPRVLQNVLNNALKYTPQGGQVWIKTAEKGGKVEISMHDNGPGIPEADLPLIFDRFHQAKARRSGSVQGTGLGLAFCREALKAMQGEIAAASAPRLGTEFTIRVPSAAEGA